MHRGLPQARAFTAKAACCSACFLLIVLPAIASAGTYSGGSGTGTKPYRISTVSDWQELMATPTDWAGRFILTSDIDLNGVSITPIAPDTSTSSEFQGTPFTGVFDGNDHVIHNVDVNMPGSDYVGLFGCLGTNGQIRNLRIVDTVIAGDDFVGGLVGFSGEPRSTGGAIADCYSTGSVTGTGCVGGLVGYNQLATISNCRSDASASGKWNVGALVGVNVGNRSNSGTISNCYSAGSVSGEGILGGLVGLNSYGTISNCYSNGSVSGTDDYVGGLAGYNSHAIISNCNATGWVSGRGSYVGGLVGTNEYSTISGCHSSGSVSGTGDYVGGLAGDNSWGTVSNCYSSGSGSGERSTGGLVGRNYYSAVSNCYSTGSVEGTGAGVGGLVGSKYGGVVSNCYSNSLVSGAGDYVGGLVGDSYYGGLCTGSFWDVNTSGWATSAGGTPKTTAEMMTLSTFISANWDFIGETANGTADIWAICEGTNYPRFVYQIPQGDIVCPDGVNSVDYSLLARYWHETDCAALDDCEGADIDLSGAVDFGDVAAVAESWLRDVR